MYTVREIAQSPVRKTLMRENVVRVASPTQRVVHEVVQAPVERVVTSPVQVTRERAVREVSPVPYSVGEVVQAPGEKLVREVVQAPAERVVTSPVQNVIGIRERAVREVNPAHCVVREVVQAPVVRVVTSPLQAVTRESAVRGYSPNDRNCKVTKVERYGCNVEVSFELVGHNLSSAQPHGVLFWGEREGGEDSTYRPVKTITTRCDGQVSGMMIFASIPDRGFLQFRYADDFSRVSWKTGGHAIANAVSVPVAATPAPAPMVTMGHGGGAKKKALLVGINYIHEDPGLRLEGCINDVRGQMDVLQGHFGFEKDNIRLLTDDQQDFCKKPDKKNIVEGIEWLMQGAEPGATLFFQYSGHGTQVPDEDGDEEDGMDEAICPINLYEDWPRNLILDDYFTAKLHDGLPAGVKIVCIFDCCHSGTMLDLPGGTHLRPGGSGKNHTREIETGKPRFAPPPPHVQEQYQKVQKMQTKSRGLKKPATSSAKSLWVVSGCQDAQTSADAFIDGKKQGALTWSIASCLADANYKISYDNLLHNIRAKLRDGGYQQIPELGAPNKDWSQDFLK